MASLLLAGIVGFFIYKAKQNPNEETQPLIGTTEELPDQWTQIYSAEGTSNVVWEYQTSYGLLYEDGTDDRYYETFFVIGNPTHTGFVSDSSNRGQITINGKKAKAYPNAGEAVSELNRMAAQPTGPTQPQLPPVTPPPSTDFFGGAGNNAPQF